MKRTSLIIHRIWQHIRRHRVAYACVAGVLVVYWTVRLFFTPPLLAHTHFSTAYYDRNGNLMRLTLSADDKYRLFTPLNKISPDIARATILYEDKYFWYHPGINPVSLTKATVNWFRGAPHPAGASTITMQVARILYNLDTRRPVGKLEQIAAAIYIDAFYSKREILETYLNLAPYGGNIEGVGAAALVYFHHRAQDMPTIESITLATIPQNPTRRGLNTNTGLNNIMNMRGDLVRRWVAANPDDVHLVTLAEMPLNTYNVRDLPFDAPHFTDRQIATRQNYWADIGARNSEIRTTLDINLQKRLTQTLRQQIARRKSHGVNNAAAILVNYKTMQVLAHIGSVDYFDKSIFGENDGVTARRSPGSTLKPLIYAAATDRGLIHGMTLLRDAKISFGVYAPENSDSEFYGPVLAHTALTHSRNIPAIDLLRKIGVRNFYQMLSDYGVENLKSPDHYGISIALGGAEVSMSGLAGIYTGIANLGRHYAIRTNLDTPLSRGVQILSPEANFLTLDMLARQSAPSAALPFERRTTSQIRHYWKTGTSSSYRDAWTAGIFGDYVLIVWVGNFDGTPNNAFSGARTAAPIYFALADTVASYDAARGHPIQNNNFLRDDMNVALVPMCDGVGGLAGQHCPKTVYSYFIPGVSPIDTSPIYRAVAIDNATGLRACDASPDTTHTAVYEFWDAEYLDMFRRAGVTRNTPPPFMPGCNLDEIVDANPTNVIISPIADTRIVITDNRDIADVSFQAISTRNDATIFWFVDDDFIGKTRSGEIISRPIKMGTHTVRTSDALGNAGRTEFSVIK